MTMHPLTARTHARTLPTLTYVLILLVCAPGVRSQTKVDDARPRYRIDVEIDDEARTYTGTQRVRWTNTHERATNVLYFRLYPNLRPPADDLERAEQDTAEARDKREDQDRREERNGKEKRDKAEERERRSALSAADEPRIEITGVHLRVDDRDAGNLPFAFEERGASLRVTLRSPVTRGASVEVELSFSGSLPEIDEEQTGLFAHVVQGVDAALRDRQEIPRARDLNFRSRGVTVLSAWHPVLAVRDRAGDWQRKASLHLGRVLFAEAADYDVHITLPRRDRDAAYPEVFTAGTLARLSDPSETRRRLEFTGKHLRDFAIVIGHGLRSIETSVGDVRVRSVFVAEQEPVATRMLEAARSAVEIYTARFGRLPHNQITIIAAPLAAGRGALELGGVVAVASAFYVDFDAPDARNLPEIVREQRQSVEDSLEWTIVQGIAHQWWGAGAVGSDPRRAPVLDEGLAQWSALEYFRARHGSARAAQVLEDQLRGIYAVYRTFGGDDREADRQAIDYRNSFQYAAIVGGKGALLIEALRRQLGDERTIAALRDYYTDFAARIAQPEDLRERFARRATTAEERRQIMRLFDRWLSERRGDEDIAPPNAELVDALGLSALTPKTDAKNAGDAKPQNGNGVAGKIQAPGVAGARGVARFGRFFWKQMTRIR